MPNFSFDEFLDDRGKISWTLPDHIRKVGSYLSSIIYETTDDFTDPNWRSEIECIIPECRGTISSNITLDNRIRWACSECVNNKGLIDSWQGTRWDNTKRKLTEHDRRLLHDFFNDSISIENNRLLHKRFLEDHDLLRVMIRMLDKMGDNKTDIMTSQG